MTARPAVHLVAGVLADERARPGTRSLVERAEDAGADIFEWSALRAQPGLDVFEAGDEEHDPRLLVGVLIAQMEPGELGAGPVGPERVRAALDEAREGLRALGEEAEPAIFLAWTADG